MLEGGHKAFRRNLQHLSNAELLRAKCGRAPLAKGSVGASVAAQLRRRCTALCTSEKSLILRVVNPQRYARYFPQLAAATLAPNGFLSQEGAAALGGEAPR